MRNVGWAIEVARRHVMACHGFVSPCPSWRPPPALRPPAPACPDPGFAWLAAGGGRPRTRSGADGLERMKMNEQRLPVFKLFSHIARFQIDL